tara:strand:- start:4427 stop:4561 length:135 start_codon:yes stop_codon:yes gene_type:complete
MIQEEIYLNELIAKEAWIINMQEMLFGYTFYFFIGLYIYRKLSP